MAADKTVEDVRAAARELTGAIDQEVAARKATRKAAHALVVATEGWQSPRHYHAVTHAASGLLHDIDEDEVSREHTRQELREFLDLVDFAATERKEAVNVG